MARFTVVIRPEGVDDSTHGEATVVVETGSQIPRIVEMTVRASSPDGVSTVTLPSIDLEGVVRALSAGVRATAASPAAVPTPPSTPRRVPVSAVQGDRSGNAAPTDDTSDAAEAPSGPAHPAGRNSGRPYRQMPAVEDLKAVYDRVGTVTGVATHYGVPRYTAQGWVARLRKMTG